MIGLSHPELHRVSRVGWLRAAVLGANDGIVSTASLIVGVAAAATDAEETVAGCAAFSRVAALACTPLKTSFGWTWPIRLRRMLGLFGFSYALLHVSTYAALDQVLDWHAIWEDVTRRKFILVGFTSFVLLSLLAATSFNQAVKWLGAKRWQMLHRVVYLIAALALLHFFWMRAGKNNFAEVWVYTTIIATLLAWRIKWRFK